MEKERKLSLNYPQIPFLSVPLGHNYLLGKSCPCVILNLMPSSVFCIPFLFGVSGSVWNLIVSVPDHCLFIYFDTNRHGAKMHNEVHH